MPSLYAEYKDQSVWNVIILIRLNTTVILYSVTKLILKLTLWDLKLSRINCVLTHSSTQIAEATIKLTWTNILSRSTTLTENDIQKSINVISQTLKHVWNMFNFNTTSNPCGYLVSFVSKTPLVVWYFIIDLIPLKVCSYFALFESKSAVIFICTHCLIISFKLCKFTWTLRRVFSSPNLNSYIVFY